MVQIHINELLTFTKDPSWDEYLPQHRRQDLRWGVLLQHIAAGGAWLDWQSSRQVNQEYRQRCSKKTS